MKIFKKYSKRNLIPLDNFITNVLYDKRFGYYTSKNPFGKKGDFITSPGISKLFSEIISIWIVATWKTIGEPKNLNIVELGPGDGSFIKVLLDVSKKFPKFNSSKNVYLYEKSEFLRQIQKRKLKKENVQWLKNFKKIKKGPVIFFGNEFLDAIPIKQFKREKNSFFEKYYTLNDDNKISEIFKPAKKNDIKLIRSFMTLKNLTFIELPKIGFNELKNIIDAINKLGGCILIIDYGYLKTNNINTLQSVINNKKNHILKNLGKADITAHVNFTLLKEFFLKHKFQVNKIISQKEFLKNMGILERAETVAKKMNFKDKADLYLRLKRLLSPKLMGELFKVIVASKFKV